LSKALRPKARPVFDAERMHENDLRIAAAS
jgi:hypothetical protein